MSTPVEPNCLGRASHKGPAISAHCGLEKNAALANNICGAAQRKLGSCLVESPASPPRRQQQLRGPEPCCVDARADTSSEPLLVETTHNENTYQACPSGADVG